MLIEFSERGRLNRRLAKDLRLLHHRKIEQVVINRLKAAGVDGIEKQMQRHAGVLRRNRLTVIK